MVPDLKEGWWWEVYSACVYRSVCVAFLYMLVLSLGIPSQLHPPVRRIPLQTGSMRQSSIRLRISSAGIHEHFSRVSCTTLYT